MGLGSDESESDEEKDEVPDPFDKDLLARLAKTARSDAISAAVSAVEKSRSCSARSRYLTSALSYSVAPGRRARAFCTIG